MQLFSADSILEVLYCNKFWKFCFCTRLNKLKTSNRINIVTSDKVQLISKCLLGVIVSTNKRKKNEVFLPKPLEKIIPIMLNNPYLISVTKCLYFFI